MYSNKTMFKTYLPISKSGLTTVLFFLFTLLLPTQLGKYFFFDFSYIQAIRVDYLAIKLLCTDILAFTLIILFYKQILGWVRLHQKLLLTLSLFFVLNIVYSPEPLLGLYTLYKYTEILCVGLVFYFARPKWQIITSAFLIGSIGELVLSIGQMATHGSLGGIFYLFGERFLASGTPSVAKTYLQGVEILRPYGTFSHPNSLGGFYLLVYTFQLVYTRFVLKNNVGLLSMATILCSTLLILISFSRIAITGYLVITVFYLTFFLQSTCRLCRFGRILGVLFISGLFLTTVHNPSAISERLALFQNGLSLLSQKPLLGWGLGQHVYGLSAGVTNSPYLFNQPIHNIFLIALVEWGLIIFSLLSVTLYSLYKKADNKMLYLIFLAVVITGMFDHYWLTLQQNQLLLGVVAGFVLYKTNPFNKE